MSITWLLAVWDSVNYLNSQTLWGGCRTSFFSLPWLGSDFPGVINEISENGRKQSRSENFKEWVVFVWSSELEKRSQIRFQPEDCHRFNLKWKKSFFFFFFFKEKKIVLCKIAKKHDSDRRESRVEEETE